ncbi:hypothetical protein [Streptomyces sp. NPDC086777]|uniref:hypothetical protein n=1 Tax=Streptomyces sp. NPDC086777 TaxID=3154866 RepID=UPI00344BA315
MPRFYARRRLSILAAFTGPTASAALLDSPSASTALPTPVSASTARTYPASLTVAAENRTGYERDLFPTRDTVSGTCNTREWILERDGTNAVTNSACTATSGSWYSPYDGATWTAASDVDIDHLASAPVMHQAPEAAVEDVDDIPLTHAMAPRTGRTAAPDTETNLPAEARGL